MKWEEIKREVERKGNVATVTMECLRGAYGAGKLGSQVREQISKTLAGMGLGHVPETLPANQHEQVRLYKQGTAVGEIIRTVLTPGEQHDKVLTRYVGNDTPNYEELIEKIRDLVS